ncbi:hypothetical protein CANCADRAFT_135279 [Tortispora caseinolytica NRRL Y-17796]|uniref:UBC core domain-containing protein n=1 Tax=Tortispora caseinolytica NRRL Y-17796 TaxID=767744 RepID=A0A1E4TBV8_9ASCO|nr:hypothetical protein CANCADRAFT_135279 [Tortispora caseinolytica NRRL Y-17796]
MSKASSSLIMKQYAALRDPKTKLASFQVELKDDDIYTWIVYIFMLDKDSLYYGGIFRAEMVFPIDYPFSPPRFRFLTPVYHPNVYPTGELCISILHSGEDETSGEAAAERWSPAQTAESVLLSILSLLEDPNPNSPANIDAGVDFRNNMERYKQKVLQTVENSKETLPAGIEFPSEDQTAQTEPETFSDEDDYWWDSAAEDDYDEDLSVDNE